MHVSVCSYGQWCRPLLFETNAKPIPMHWELDWLNMNLNKCTHISTHMRCHIFFNFFFSASSLFICLTVLCIRFARMHTILSNDSRQFHNSKKETVLLVLTLSYAFFSFIIIEFLLCIFSLLVISIVSVSVIGYFLSFYYYWNARKYFWPSWIGNILLLSV